MTEAGKRLIDWAATGQIDVSESFARDMVEKIEAEAVAAERARIAEAVRELEDVGDDRDCVLRAAVLAIVEEP